MKIGPLPGHVSRDQLEYAVREVSKKFLLIVEGGGGDSFSNVLMQVGALRRLFLQHNHMGFRPAETRFAYVVFRRVSSNVRHILFVNQPY